MCFKKAASSVRPAHASGSTRSVSRPWLSSAAVDHPGLYGVLAETNPRSRRWRHIARSPTIPNRRNQQQLPPQGPSQPKVLTASSTASTTAPDFDNGLARRLFLGREHGDLFEPVIANGTDFLPRSGAAFPALRLSAIGTRPRILAPVKPRKLQNRPKCRSRSHLPSSAQLRLPLHLFPATDLGFTRQSRCTPATRIIALPAAGH